jgi:hypothetical protein
MRKNLLGALVIIFVAFACFLVMKEMSNPANTEVDSQQYYADSE